MLVADAVLGGTGVSRRLGSCGEWLPKRPGGCAVAGAAFGLVAGRGPKNPGVAPEEARLPPSARGRRSVCPVIKHSYPPQPLYVMLLWLHAQYRSVRKVNSARR